MIGGVSDSATPSSQLSKVLGVAALIDLVTGIALSVIGLVTDVQAFAIVGVLLLLSGGAMLAFVVWQRSKPLTL
jgi:uncharacterized membrane protein HdeD (DUF308 family)